MAARGLLGDVVLVEVRERRAEPRCMVGSVVREVRLRPAASRGYAAMSGNSVSLPHVNFR